VSTTVGELLFKGYFDPLLQKLATLMPGTDPYFSVMLGKNNTDKEGIWSVGSGTEDIKDFNRVYEWNNNNTVPFWGFGDRSSPCNAINGTDGTMFAPGVTKDQRLYIFNTDLCRSVYFTYANDTSVGTIDTYKFSIPFNFYKSPSIEPSNECFCVRPKDEQEFCQLNGLLDISSCQEDAPVIVSAPHFYQGSDVLYTFVSGLHPDAAIHETYVNVEPTLGVVLEGYRRIQINVEIIPHAKIDKMSKLHSMAMPVIWLEESAVAGKSDIDLVTSKLNEIKSKTTLFKGIFGAILALGGILLIITAAVAIHRKRNRGTTFA
jgi:lysosome membrane protein 2